MLLSRSSWWICGFKHNNLMVSDRESAFKWIIKFSVPKAYGDTFKYGNNWSKHFRVYIKFHGSTILFKIQKQITLYRIFSIINLLLNFQAFLQNLTFMALSTNKGINRLLRNNIKNCAKLCGLSKELKREIKVERDCNNCEK